MFSFKNIAIITSTSDLENFKSKKIKSFKGGKINIGSIGRLNWEKNFKQLIKIGKKLKKLDMFDFQITIIGDGPDYINLKHLIENEKLEKTIFLKGELSRDDVIDFLSNLDIYIQTSISEGSPLTIKEAMAVPLIVLASDVGGVGNLIQNNINGFLVEKNNTDQFVETLLNVLKLSDKEIFKIKESARQFILLNFSPDMVAHKLFKYLKEKID